MAQDDQNSSKISQLKTLRESVDWKIEEDRIKFFKNFYPLIENWIDGLPNLRDIFQQDEIELLLMDSIKNWNRVPYTYNLAQRIIQFVISTGYKDEPKLDEEGKPLVVRTTPVHIAVRKHLVFFYPELFKIYDRFDVNYTDESGYTHFHAALLPGCEDVAEKFLKLGQDPNCIWRKTGESTLHLALKYDQMEMFELLLRRGADPSLANARGVTPLHRICELHRNVDWAKMILEFNDDTEKTERLVNARDNYGYTPLHYAMNSEHVDLIEFLLTKGADPNAATDVGQTPLHIISPYSYKDDSAKMFFKICDEKKKTLQLDAKDKLGRTPLQLAMDRGSRYIAESLLARGADPHLANAEGSTPLHLICKSFKDVDCAKMIFDINDDTEKTELLVSARDKFGQTPLHLAMKNERADLIELLLRRGADPNAVDVHEVTPLKMIRQGNEELLELFRKIREEKEQLTQVGVQD